MSFSSVGILGTGPTACTIAIAIAQAGIGVTMVAAARHDPPAVRARIEARLAFSVRSGERTAVDASSISSLIAIAPAYGALADCDLVIESAAADPRTRRGRLATLESRLSPGAVLATSSDHDDLEYLAQALRRPDQFVGLRLAPPRGSRPEIDLASGTPVVEVALLPDAAPGVVAACRAFVRELGTSTVERDLGTARVEYREFLSGGGG